MTDKAQTLLPFVDHKNSLEGAHIDSTTRAFAYTPFGHNPDIPKDTLLAFNGEPCERFSHLYLLGQGYRAFNTRLMRFHSPDSLSPFAPYCMNSYSYCLGDPINFSDPSGHMPKAIPSRASKYGKNSTNLTRPPSPKNPTSPPRSPSPLDLTNPARSASSTEDINRRVASYLKKLTEQNFVAPRNLKKFDNPMGDRLFSHIPGISNPNFQVTSERPVPPPDPLKNGLIEGMFDNISEPLQEAQRPTVISVISENVTHLRQT